MGATTDTRPQADTERQPLNAREYEERARAVLPTAVYGYYAGGASDEVTLHENCAAFERLRFRPRVLRRVGTVRTDVSTSTIARALVYKDGGGGSGVGDGEFTMPVIVAPMAMQKMAHTDGELGVARACSTVGIPMCVSTLATTSLEDIARVGMASLLFQLYVYKDRTVTRALVHRAREAGYKAVVVTVDTPKLGRRERDLRNAFALPVGTRLANFEADGVRGKDSPIGDSKESSSALQRYVESLYDADVTWDDIRELVLEAGMPVWVKGVLTAEDAKLALDCGVAAIVVSNHGARQLDGVMPTIDALPHVVHAVRGRVPVVVDSGVRRGADVVRALALGASAVMLGRPVLWGLAVDGERGVTRVLSMLMDEIRLTMTLLGAATPADIQPDMLVQSNPTAAPLADITAKL